MKLICIGYIQLCRLFGWLLSCSHDVFRLVSVHRQFSVAFFWCIIRFCVCFAVLFDCSSCRFYLFSSPFMMCNALLIQFGFDFLFLFIVRLRQSCRQIGFFCAFVRRLMVVAFKQQIRIYCIFFGLLTNKTLFTKYIAGAQEKKYFKYTRNVHWSVFMWSIFVRFCFCERILFNLVKIVYHSSNSYFNEIF